MIDFYILDDNNNVVLVNIEEYTEFYGSSKKFIRSTKQDNIHVSTVFLGINHNLDPNSGNIIIFETMVFLKGESVYVDQYSTYQQAVVGHIEKCKMFNVKYSPDINDSYQVIKSIDDI